MRSRARPMLVCLSRFHVAVYRAMDTWHGAEGKVRQRKWLKSYDRSCLGVLRLRMMSLSGALETDSIGQALILL